MKSKTFNSLKLNRVSVSNLSSISGGLVANNNNNQQPMRNVPSTAGPTWDCGYSAGCKTKGCANG
ncbi:hypothetical protein IMCC3317_26990 [Kordia antarctica]|uniref:Uncharacterized protein n=1 Tax=Kordia antarctica TaxID=1218801 RepID=A0A7L4ZLB6_9FLAO|nr:hypothetical protein [Kordia antarctica]QHI37320.1 hypothetical protein IMCC3317_26990 [Kordia antarctica]